MAPLPARAALCRIDGALRSARSQATREGTRVRLTRASQRCNEEERLGRGGRGSCGMNWTRKGVRAQCMPQEPIVVDTSGSAAPSFEGDVGRRGRAILLSTSPRGRRSRTRTIRNYRAIGRGRRLTLMGDVHARWPSRRIAPGAPPRFNPDRLASGGTAVSSQAAWERALENAQPSGTAQREREAKPPPSNHRVWLSGCLGGDG